MQSKLPKVIIGIFFLLIVVLVHIVDIHCAQGKNNSSKNGQIMNKKEAKIILWDHKKNIFLNQYPFAKKIQRKCESIFEGADSTYKLSIGKGLIKKLKEKEVSIEIIYTIPVVFYPLYWQTRTKPKKVHILRLLIPITGRFSEPPTIFYGTQQDKLTDGNPLEYGAFNNLINNYAKEEIHYIKQMLKTNLNLNL